VRIRPPSDLAPGIPREIDDIVMRALSRDPAVRYPTARAMARELEACVRPMRFPEIGAWVEELVGETLAHRSAVLARIEREEADAEVTIVSTGERPCVASENDAESATDESLEVLEGPIGLPASRPRGRVWMAAVALAILCTLLALPHRPIRSLVWVHRAAPAQTPGAQTRTSTVATQPTAAPPGSAPPPQAVTAPPPPSKPPNEPCNPPFVVDSLGHPTFKVECLKRDPIAPPQVAGQHPGGGAKDDGEVERRRRRSPRGLTDSAVSATHFAG
jgi:serine/threonine-protein kinase